jgi:hypothetical protein
VQEKAEAQQSAGVDAVRSRLIDRQPGDKILTDETDREAARTLLGAGKKRKKKSQAVPLLQRTWVKAAGILLLLAAIGVAVWLFSRPPSAEKLYHRIETLMASQDPADQRKAFEDAIPKYLNHYRKRDDDRTRQVREWQSQLGVRLEEEDLADIRKKAKVIKFEKMDALTEGQRVAYRATLAEDEGDLTRAAVLWKQVADKEPDGTNGYLAEVARRRLAVVQQGVAERAASLDKLLAKTHDSRDESFAKTGLKGEPEKEAFRALRYERFGDLFEARRRWVALKEKAQDKPAERVWFLLAANRVREVGKKLPREVENETAARLKVVEGRLGAAREEAAARHEAAAEAICLDIRALYADGAPKEFADVVRANDKLLGELEKVLPLPK